MLTFTPTDNLELPISLICMSDCGRKLENQEGNHTDSNAHAGGRIKLATISFMQSH